MDQHNFGLKQTTAPSAAVVATSDAKAWLRIDHSDEDTLIASLVTRATNVVEHLTNRQMINASWTYQVDQFPHQDAIFFPIAPLVSVTSISYTDGDGASQTLGTSVYGVGTIRDPGRIFLKSGQEWPSTLDQANVVTVVAVAGYGASASDVPEPLKHAVLMLVSHYYEHREAVDPRGNTFAEVPLGVKNICHQFEVGKAY